ncbi:MAG: hypothetical protein J07HQW2_00481 [Haloquadratum walsbyi J07HQW2]|uniref:Uncharacterized protein n=1 Tax=Haloquadratum walsbyi J07HQW2 TaxID=1238425 RepID=U1PK48_9EURY|nr:MAG: hypothetical protein J07HQW2_00481 [Haloquadratum walsbyi J07HQW2]
MNRQSGFALLMFVMSLRNVAGGSDRIGAVFDSVRHRNCYDDLPEWYNPLWSV